ncbi:MAG TPA: AMP-binding protein, partial [Candidatus Ozemobacteraceae bacterium]|nr:AMP-binding protein [Candidatus Ozemobacteraceae bacterium]
MFDNNVLKLTQLPVDSKKVALSCDLGGGQWVDMNYLEFKEIIDEVTKVFMMIGLKKNDRVLIISENHYKWLPVFLGITGFGAVAMPIDGGIVDSRLLAIIENSQPRAIIVSKKYQ